MIKNTARLIFISSQHLRLFAWLVLLALMFVSTTNQLEASTQKNRPNVLLFITDDESWLERSAYGWSSLPTPQFDRVAEQGVLFTHGYSSSSSCAPARAALMTGRNFWELEHGAYIQAWLPKKFPLFQNLLSEHGYHTGIVGKGWGPGVDAPEGYPVAEVAYQDKRNAIRIKNPGKYMSPYDYAANFEVFMEEREEEQPFFCWVGVTEPHGPWAKGNYKKLEEEYGVTLDEVSVPGMIPDTLGLRRERANFLYEICYADEQLGKMLDLLEQQGELDNTIVIVTSDNGTQLPRAKFTAYDWGLHVPLAIMWPEQVLGGRVVEDFVGFPDFGPTILEAAGCSIPDSMSGRSFLNVLLSSEDGQVDPTREWIVGGLEWHGELPPFNRATRMIRDDRYAYIVNYGNQPKRNLNKKLALPDSEFVISETEEENWFKLITKHPEHPAIAPYVDSLIAKPQPEELYDLEIDPWQANNVIDDPSYASVLDRLREKMITYQVKTGDPRATGDMRVFDAARKFVQDRKRNGYR